MLSTCLKKKNKASVYRCVFCIVWSPSFYVILIEIGEKIQCQVEVTVSPVGQACVKDADLTSYPHGMFEELKNSKVP